MEKRVDVVFILGGLPGLGHVTPGVAIAEKLAEKGIGVHFVTYANGSRFLKNRRERNLHVIRTPDHRSGIVPWKEMFEATLEILPVLKSLRPKLVVIDGEWDLAFLLRGLGIKVVTLMTKTYVEHDFGVYLKYSDYIDSLIGISDKVIVHGTERPYLMGKNIIFAGPIMGKLNGNITEKDIIPINIGFQASKRLAKGARMLGRAIERSGIEPFVIGSGDHGSKFITNSLDYFKSARFIVSDGGMATIEEAAVLGKRVILLCESYDEKNRNAISVKRLGHGKILNFKKKISMETMIKIVENLISSPNTVNPMKNGVDIAVASILQLIC